MEQPTKITVTLKSKERNSKPIVWGPGFNLLKCWLEKLTKQTEMEAQLEIEDAQGNQHETHRMTIEEAYHYVEGITQ